MPGLSRDASQAEPEAKSNEGVNDSNNPQSRSDDPGGLVKNSSNHSYDDNETKACDGPNLCTTDTAWDSSWTKFTDNIQIYKNYKKAKKQRTLKSTYPEDLFGYSRPPTFHINSQSNWNKKGHKSDTWGQKHVL